MYFDLPPLVQPQRIIFICVVDEKVKKFCERLKKVILQYLPPLEVKPEPAQLQEINILTSYSAG